MKKNIFTITLLCYTITNYCAKQQKPSNAVIERFSKKSKKHELEYIDNITIQNTVFVFDLHDVLFKLDLKKARHAFLQSKQKTLFLGDVLWYGFNRLLSKKQQDPNFCVEKALEQQDGSLVDGALEIMNAHKPIPETLTVVKKLHEEGYKLFICSNIGKKSYEYLEQQYPDIFQYFSGKTIATKENNYTIKNTKAFFEECRTMVIKMLKSTEPTHIIIIDDSKKKLKLAQQAGMIGIHFTNAKALEALLYQAHVL